MATITLYVTANADDAYEGASTTMYDVAHFATTSPNGHFGFRFLSSSIPVGAEITAAYIEIYINDDDDDDIKLSIYAEKSDSPAAFSATPADISDRTIQISIYTSWDDEGSTPEATTATEAGWVRSPDIKTVIQTLIDDSANYDVGDAIVMICNSEPDIDLGVYFHNQDPKYGPRLIVDYTPNPPEEAPQPAGPKMAMVTI
jgi:hypothetical protein